MKMKLRLMQTTEKMQRHQAQYDREVEKSKKWEYKNLIQPNIKDDLTGRRKERETEEYPTVQQKAIWWHHK